MLDVTHDGIRKFSRLGFKSVPDIEEDHVTVLFHDLLPLCRAKVIFPVRRDRSGIQGDNLPAHLDDQLRKSAGVAIAHLDLNVIEPRIRFELVNVMFYAVRRPGESAIDPFRGDQDPSFQLQRFTERALARGKNLGVQDLDVFVKENNWVGHLRFKVTAIACRPARYWRIGRRPQSSERLYRSAQRLHGARPGIVRGSAPFRRARSWSGQSRRTSASRKSL